MDFESTRNCVTYGSIISFMNYSLDNNETPTLSYDPENLNQNLSNNKKEDYIDFIKSGNFLYSNGVFNEFCYLYSFKNKKDIQNNFFNTLFLVLPPCEYDSMLKFKHLIKSLKNEILMDDSPTINNLQIEDLYIKFKQEIQTNHEQSVKLMREKNNRVNFNDCVQFLHIKTGKFLSFKKHDDHLKTYIELTEKVSKNTIFRFTPAYQYQAANSTNVYFDLTIQIACGEKRTRKEKYVSNIRNYKMEEHLPEESKAVLFGKQLLNREFKKQQRPLIVNERAKNIRTSIKNIFMDGNPNVKSNIKENLLTYSTNSNLAYKNFGKKLLPENDYIGVDIKSEDYWKLILYSQNYIKDNQFINSLDFFSIQNIEKNLFIELIDVGKGQEDENEFDNILEGRKEELLNKNKNKDKNKVEIKTNQHISEKSMDEKEKAPHFPFSVIKNSTIIDKEKDSNFPKDNKKFFIDNIDLNYDLDDNFYSNFRYKLNVGHYNENDFIEPLGLFKFEIISDNKNINNDLKINIKILLNKCYVRIINVFSNKVFCVDKNELKIIDNNIDKTDKLYENTLFKIEISNEEPEDNSAKNNDDSDNHYLIYDNKDKLILKNDYIKIKAKKCGEYIGIRYNNNSIESSSHELVLTKSQYDLTKFKLNFLDEDDKYELHFFKQLLMSLVNIANYFKQEKENNIDESNYENIQHILITLENKIKIFKDNRNVKIVQENKFDFLKIIDNFNIVSTLTNLFISNWFHNHKNLDYNKIDLKLTKFFKEKKDELKCKQLISKKILKILTLIYDLDKSYLDKISDRLIYFFMFVGRDDKCTKFLVHILKNNRKLLISLCPTNIEPKNNNNSSSSESVEDENSFNDSNNNSPTYIVYENMKKCLKRIIRDYNHLDIVKLTIYFSSVFLFFKLMNCLLIYNNQPFMQFYDYYFEGLDILVEAGEKYEKPNYRNNPILIDFEMKEENLYARKAKFFSSEEGEIIEENYTENDEDESDTNKISSSNKNPTNSSQSVPINSRELVEFKLIDLIGINSYTNIDKYYRQILYAKLVSLNIFFYSNIALCNSKFKEYLKTLFNINGIINNYLSINKIDEPIKTKKMNNLNNDLKCSLVQLLNYLYFRIPFPFWEKINLFKYIERGELKKTQTELINSDAKENSKIQEESLDNIIIYVKEIITNNININEIRSDPFLLLQILECTKYILRYLYSYKNKQKNIDCIFDLMAKILKLLDKYIGMSKIDKIDGKLNESLNSILDDQLELKEPLFLVTDNFQFLFQKFRKKLENTIKNKEIKNLKKVFKDLFGTAVAKEEKNYITDSLSRNLKRKSVNKLKNLNLSHILLEISINSNKEQKTIINEIMFMMTDIFLEFLQYVESLSIDEVGMKLLEIKKVYNGNTKDFERLIIEEVIKRNEDEVKNYSPGILRHKYYEYEEQPENKYLDKFKQILNMGDSISCFFFKFIRNNDNVELNNLTMQIIYRLNNQQKIYYDNVSNYVIFYFENDFKKFLKIKNLFNNIFNIIKNINLVKRLDKSTFKLYEELNEIFDELVMNLYNQKKWRHENSVLNLYENIKFYDDEEEENGSNSESDSESEVESFKNEKKTFAHNKKEKEEIIDTTVKKENNNINNNDNKENSNINKKESKLMNKNNYYFNENNNDDSNINLLITQQTLYNLGFINLINEFFEYIEWIVENIEELKDELFCVEKILISIYKLLVLFIYKNNKHQTIIKDKLYLYICPLKLKKKGQYMLCYIGYFILNLVYNFKNKNELNQIKDIDKIINTLYLLHSGEASNNVSGRTVIAFDWNNCKEIIPFYVEFFRKIIEYSPPQYFQKLYQILIDITNVLLNQIANKTETKNDIISLKRILQLITSEQDKKTNGENRNSAILSLDKITHSFLDMIKLLIPQNKLDFNYLKLCKIFTYVTNLVYYHFPLYKAAFDARKLYHRKFVKILVKFCNKIKITNSMIYIGKNKNPDLKDFNEFLGLTIPKLYIISQITDDKNDLEEENNIKNIINTSDKFYKKIYNIITTKTNNKEPMKIFLSIKNVDEVMEILNNVDNDSLRYMEVVFNIVKRIPKLSLINTKPTIVEKSVDQFEQYNDNKQLKFIEMWNKIQLEINYRKGLNKFQEIVKTEINKDRKNFVLSLFNFFEDIEKNKNNNIKKMKEDNKNLKPGVSFYSVYFNAFKDFYGADIINYKSVLYFFYWSNIFLMQYNQQNKSFDNKTKFNKEYFYNLNIVEFTIKQFLSVNAFSNNYENLLFIKFFNSYLRELDDENRANCLMLFIDKPEAKNIFSLLSYILGELQKKINVDIKNLKNKLLEKDAMEPDLNSEDLKDVNYYYSPHLFENDLEEYDIVLELISNLSENNDKIQGKMKDYLRMQYNNSKYLNFIIILVRIIESFVMDENNSNIFLIEKYFNIIIKIIDCITKCCNGASKENQDCVVKETQMLKFTKFVLEKLTYRPKKYFDDGLNSYSNNPTFKVKSKETLNNKNNLSNIEKMKRSGIECQEIGLDRRRLAYLKYKLLLFLSVLTVGRKKDDKIYELIHQVIDFNSLVNVLVETYKEILIEKNCTNKPDLLSFDEDMLSRMDNPEYKNLSKWDYTLTDENFIIFEIGTYTFILINIYLENLTKPIDIDIYNQIIKIRNVLKKIKCNVEKKSVLNDFKNFILSIGKVFKWNCSKTIKINEDFLLTKSFARSYRFFFEYTPNIEINFNNEIIKYYVKLSPICKCLTNEMKEEFHANLDRSSTKSKIECLFENIEFFQYQLTITKKRIDIFHRYPVLDLFFNNYKFYRDIFLVINAFLNLLIFSSYYKIDDNEFDYGFLYRNDYIEVTLKVLKSTTIVETILAFLIFVNYIIIHIPNLTYYNQCVFNIEENENKNSNNKSDSNNKMKKINVNFKHFISIITNIFKDIKLLFHLILLIICILVFILDDYRLLVGLLIDVIERSKILMCIVKSIWLPKKQIIVTLFLFYLISYYFSIFVYLFIPSHVPTMDCIKFSNCFFTLSDQMIKNSNGIINFLKEDGLYDYSTLWGNPRFYIDNWFAIIDSMLVLQIFAAIIIDNFIAQREENDKIEKDKKNKCFICGLKKTELDKYYNQNGFNEHINLDHNLWNYMFVIFNIMKKNYHDLITIDLMIYESYKKKMYSLWVPYKKCKLQIDEDLKEEKNKEESEDEEEEKENEEKKEEEKEESEDDDNDDNDDDKDTNDDNED